MQHDSLSELLHRAGQIADRNYYEVMGDEVTPRQALVMTAIANNPDASQTRLVEATGIDRSTLSDIIRRLETAGLVKRKRSADDARAYVVSLTPSGRSAQQAARAAIDKTDKALTARLGKQAPELVRLLSTLAA